MTDEAALLTAIRDTPDEDMPRLAYADWLDERPTQKRKARAELIRTQIAYERRPGIDLGPVTRGAPGVGPTINLMVRSDVLRLLLDFHRPQASATVGQLASNLDWVRGHEAQPDGSRIEFEGPVTSFTLRQDAHPSAPANLTMFALGPRLEHLALANRASEILKKWGMSWLPKVGRVASLSAAVPGSSAAPLDVQGRTVNVGYGFDIDYEFSRGFIDHVRVEWPDEIEPDLNRPFPIIGAESHIKHVVGTLAGHPVRNFTFRYTNFEPAVQVEIVRDRMGWWCARLKADDRIGPGVRIFHIETDARTSRRELLKFLPTFLRRELPRVPFRYVEPRIPF